MGATLAFEVARRLEGQGAPPEHLFVSGGAPSRSRHEDEHVRDDAGLIAELAELSGTDTRLLEDEGMRRMVLPALRGDCTAAETYVYQPGPPLACPVTAITGDADPRVDRDEAEAWEEHTTGPFELPTFPGGHFYLSDHRTEVAQAVATRLLPGLPADR